MRQPRTLFLATVLLAFASSAAIADPKNSVAVERNTYGIRLPTLVLIDDFERVCKQRPVSQQAACAEAVSAILDSVKEIDARARDLNRKINNFLRTYESPM